MAFLEYVHLSPVSSTTSSGPSTFAPHLRLPDIKRLPQIFWDTGASWSEVNLWALDKIQSQHRDVETVNALLKHLHAYASYLESSGLDWRYFPARISNRSVYKYRGELVARMKDGTIAGSTASARMAAIIQFYRFAKDHGLIDTKYAMWTEHEFKAYYTDLTGFKRSITGQSTDLSIPNKSPPGNRLEDGLTPLSELHMMELIEHTRSQASEELHLMLTIGFFTGARLSTITSLRINTLELAREDQYISDLYLLSVGPGTKVKTKFDVKGDILIPGILLRRLKKYAYSPSRLKRESKSSKENSALLFITSRGKPYSKTAIGVLMTNLRREAVKAGLKFMMSFKFHQSRATYGTWLMKISLEVTTTGAAIEFVKSAMLHKHESTTLKYVKFLESSAGKQKAAQEFYEAFSGLQGRDWNKYRA
ncbi:site-specific integrase [Pseudomonas capeferrum]|uniref:tyrosine-type recombinase/integrase n=1 Tax=Pseudomonas capeferrum TaxID=1495066 RepID=UPI0015E29793|nr:site-specific integrase [Pseudomonas capeferrum]MBA1201979.1 site-specific integrase [Pseudomonas capeferrum]